MKARRLTVAAAAAWLVVATLQAGPALAQHYQSDFPPQEFQARWSKLFDRIGEDAVAVVQGRGAAADERLLLPVWHRDATRLPTTGWSRPHRDAIHAAAQRAPRT